MNRERAGERFRPLCFCGGILRKKLGRESKNPLIKWRQAEEKPGIKGRGPAVSTPQKTAWRGAERELGVRE